MTDEEYQEAVALETRMRTEGITVINGTQARLTHPCLVAMGALPALGHHPYGREETWCRAERAVAWVCGAVVAASLGLIGHALLRLWL